MYWLGWDLLLEYQLKSRKKLTKQTDYRPSHRSRGEAVRAMGEGEGEAGGGGCSVWLSTGVVSQSPQPWDPCSMGSWFAPETAELLLRPPLPSCTNVLASCFSLGYEGLELRKHKADEETHIIQRHCSPCVLVFGIRLWFFCLSIYFFW